jgi:hypothetical protein
MMVVSAQVQEMASIRQHLFDIEKMHHRIKAEYFLHHKMATNGSDRMQKSLDCGAKRQSWRANNPPSPLIEHRLPPLASDLACCFLS